MKFRGQRFIAALLASGLLLAGTNISALAAELNPEETMTAEEEQERSAELEEREEGEEPVQDVQEELPEEVNGDHASAEELEEDTKASEEQTQDPENEDAREVISEEAIPEESLEQEEAGYIPEELIPMDHSVPEDGILGEYGDFYFEDMDQVQGRAGLYSDVTETSGWRYEAITYVTDQGLMNGMAGTGKFMPDATMDRAMFATVIYRMAGSPEVSYSGKFPDVPNGQYYSQAISWANREAIIQGHSNTGLFGTKENVSREDLVTMLYRYAQYRGMDISARTSLSGFPDAGQVSGYALPAMQWAVARGIIGGRSNTGMLDPKGNASRVECAAILERFLTGKRVSQSTPVDTTKYAIMGKSSVTVDQMVRYYKARASYPDFYSDTEAPTIEAFCQIYYDECAAEGVKVEVAFCQAMKETGYLRYGGDVDIDQYNFAGIGATGNGAKGNRFDSPTIGIRAQIQHLKAYASEEGLTKECVDPRFKYVPRGTALYVEWLGIYENPYGRGWATARNYGYSIVNMISVLKTY